MKRKLLVWPSSYPTESSLVSGIFVQNQVGVLSQDFEVTVFFPKLSRWKKLIRGKDLPKSRVELRNGIKVYREEMIVPPRLFRLRTYLYSRLARKGFEKILRNWGRPDIIHAHVVLPGGWAAVKLGRQHAIPVVLTEHSGPFSVHLKSAYQRRLVQETLSQATRIIAVSPALATEIKAFCNSGKVDILGNVIKTEFFMPSRDAQERPPHPHTRFLSIALLTREKGMHHLIEAIHLLMQRDMKSFELFIGGDGPARPVLEGMARALGLSERCHFLGLLTQQEVKQWMQKCDVFVLPSLGETFGVVLGEAMACGKPVITTRSGGADFIMTEETGLLVDVANPVALADAMEAFISGRVMFHPDVIRRSISERFGEKVFLRNLSAIYEELLVNAES